MMNLTDQQLIELNEYGIIPGPGETEEEFMVRAHQCLGMKQSILEGSLELPFSKVEFSPQEPSNEILEKTQALYGIKPLWVPVFYSNKQLRPWHGGSTWIFINEGSPSQALIQLNKTFKSSETLWGMYEKSEILTHELCHVGRMAFEESRYEEMIAYYHSPSTLRKVLGPLLTFNQITITAFSGALALIGIQWIFSSPLLPLLGFILVILCLTAHFRNRFSTFKRSLNHLKIALPNQADMFHVLYRLTDEEIEMMSSLDPNELVNIFAEQEDLRKKVIFLSYFSAAT